MISKGSCPPFNQTFNIGDKLICPVCGKEFIADENTCFATTKGFVCGWACFIDKVNECESKWAETNKGVKPWKNIELHNSFIKQKEIPKKIEEEPVKKKRGRPRKNVLF